MKGKGKVWGLIFTCVIAAPCSAHICEDGLVAADTVGKLLTGYENEIVADQPKLDRLESLTSTLQGRVTAERLERGRAAIQPTKAYLASLNHSLIERDFALRDGLAALLEKKNLLMVGPGGNAKSMIAQLMLSNIHFPASMKGNFILNPTMAKRDLFRRLEDQLGFTEQLSSFMTKHLGSSTRLPDVFGPVDIPKMFNPAPGETTVREMNMLRAMANHVYGFLDELLDASPELLRELFPLLNERIIPNGERPFPAATQTIFAATNYSLNLAYSRAKKLEIPLESLFDRFGHIVYIPRKFAFDGDPGSTGSVHERWGSLVAVMNNAAEGNSMQVVPLDFMHLYALQELRNQVVIPPAVLAMVEKVGDRLERALKKEENASLDNYKTEFKSNPGSARPPYRMTRIFSGRMYAIAADALKTVVLLDWLQRDGQRPLVGRFKDVAGLVSFLPMDGPSSSNIALLKAKSPDDMDEIAGLETIEMERKHFWAAFHSTVAEMEAQFATP